MKSSAISAATLTVLLSILCERVCMCDLCVNTHSGLWMSLSMCIKFSLLHCVLCFPLIGAHQSSPTARWAFIFMTLFIYTALNLLPLANTPSSSSAHFKHLRTKKQDCNQVWRGWTYSSKNSKVLCSWVRMGQEMQKFPATDLKPPMAQCDI